MTRPDKLNTEAEWLRKVGLEAHLKWLEHEAKEEVIISNRASAARREYSLGERIRLTVGV